MALFIAEKAGIVFLAATPDRDKTRLTIRHDFLTAVPAAQQRFFFATGVRALKVLEEIRLAASGKLIAGGIVLELPISVIDQIVADCVARIGVEMIEASALAAALKRLSAQILQAYNAMQSSGAMKRLNQRYREARVAGVKLPPYERWLIENLMTMLHLDTVGAMLAALGL